MDCHENKIYFLRITLSSGRCAPCHPGADTLVIIRNRHRAVKVPEMLPENKKLEPCPAVARAHWDGIYLGFTKFTDSRWRDYTGDMEME